MRHCTTTFSCLVRAHPLRVCDALYFSVPHAHAIKSSVSEARECGASIAGEQPDVFVAVVLSPTTSGRRSHELKSI